MPSGSCRGQWPGEKKNKYSLWFVGCSKTRKAWKSQRTRKAGARNMLPLHSNERELVNLLPRGRHISAGLAFSWTSLRASLHADRQQWEVGERMGSRKGKIRWPKSHLISETKQNTNRKARSTCLRLYKPWWEVEAMVCVVVRSSRWFLAT